jgi:hypothetical protein
MGARPPRKFIGFERGDMRVVLRKNPGKELGHPKLLKYVYSTIQPRLEIGTQHI